MKGCTTAYQTKAEPPSALQQAAEIAIKYIRIIEARRDRYDQLMRLAHTELVNLFRSLGIEQELEISPFWVERQTKSTITRLITDHEYPTGPYDVQLEALGIDLERLKRASCFHPSRRR